MKIQLTWNGNEKKYIAKYLIKFEFSKTNLRNIKFFSIDIQYTTIIYAQLKLKKNVCLIIIL